MKTQWDIDYEKARRKHPVKFWWLGIQFKIEQKLYDISPKLYSIITGDKLDD